MPLTGDWIQSIDSSITLDLLLDVGIVSSSTWSGAKASLPIFLYLVAFGVVLVSIASKWLASDLDLDLDGAVPVPVSNSFNNSLSS